TSEIRTSSADYITEHNTLTGFYPGSRVVRQRQYVAPAATTDRSLRHAEHDAALLVLRDRMCTGVAHRAHAGRAVAAHAGQQHPDGLGAQCLRDGMEEHVDGRPRMMHGRTVVQRDAQLLAAPHHGHVAIAGCDQGYVRLD